MLIKQKIPSLPRSLALRTFGKLPILFSTKMNLLYLLYSTAQRCYLLHPKNQNCLLETFVRTLILMTVLSSASDKKQNCLSNTFTNSNLDESGVFLPAFRSRTNLKLHSISMTPKMVK